MSPRCVVNVATGHYVRGQQRLFDTRALWGCNGLGFDHIPAGWPKHEDKPYAMKAYALKAAEHRGSTSLLWCDACIVPIRSLDPLWEKIEAEGAVISRNGWTNAQWCADSWYADCFPGVPLEEARALNREIPHVVATYFGVSLAHPVGRAILEGYYRLASQTRAFCGPWKNTPETPCGPPEVLGHRHDQSCLSLLAHQHGVKLVDPPEIFSYPDGQDERTIVIADGAY